MHLYSKIFGDGTTGVNSTPGKRIRITTKTAYKLTLRQGQQEEHTDQVSMGLCSTLKAQMLTANRSSNIPSPGGHIAAHSPHPTVAQKMAPATGPMVTVGR
jgi:hypothetical protein